jgi:hypothetical protein
MDELRSNLAALTIDFSGAPPSSQLRNRPVSALPQTEHAQAAAPAQADAVNSKQQLGTALQPPPPKSKASAPQPFRREKQKI